MENTHTSNPLPLEACWSSVVCILSEKSKKEACHGVHYLGGDPFCVAMVGRRIQNLRLRLQDFPQPSSKQVGI